MEMMKTWVFSLFFHHSWTDTRTHQLCLASPHFPRSCSLLNWTLMCTCASIIEGRAFGSFATLARKKEPRLNADFLVFIPTSAESNVLYIIHTHNTHGRNKHKRQHVTRIPNFRMDELEHVDEVAESDIQLCFFSPTLFSLHSLCRFVFPLSLVCHRKKFDWLSNMVHFYLYAKIIYAYL